MGRIRHFQAENEQRKGISAAIMICITVIVKKKKLKLNKKQPENTL